MTGKIIKILSNDFTVLADKKYICKARGKFRNINVTPIVGDNVKFDENKKYIMEILERKNSLVRPVIANVDQAIIVTSCKKPDLDLYLLDKLLCVIEFNNIKPIICFTKIDLLLDLKEINEINQIIDYYKKIGYVVFTNQQLDEIKKIFSNKISVFTGQSGAGKSTLLNKLDSNLNLNTDEISQALGRGKHTTRHVELIDIFGGMCADTPGFSQLSLKELKKSDIKDNMVEFNEYRHLCKYRDCAHELESDCFIKEIVGSKILPSRYDNYLKFIKDDENGNSSFLFGNKRKFK